MSFFHRKVKRTAAVSNASNSNVFNNNSQDLPDALNAPDKKRVAIIGSGISGLTCAHYLAKQYDVTIFEANDYIGG